MTRPSDLYIDPSKNPWLAAASTKAVMAALHGSDAPGPALADPINDPEARFVGGAVRDALLGLPVEDIDIACRLDPDRATQRLEAAGIKVVPTGIKHGTITAISGGNAFQITSLRRDVESFGRHARVHFTADWKADAARRDFTINALYADLDGRIFDPLGGIADLKAGQIRFIGDANARITEDALRILRFFRFHARYGRGEMNAAGLAACKHWAAKLDGLSTERITQEMLKLLAAPKPAATVKSMAASGVLSHILPHSENTDRLERLSKIDPAYGKADPIRRLAALLPATAEAAGDRLRLSRQQQKRLSAMLALAPRVSPRLKETSLLEKLYKEGRVSLIDAALISWAASPSAHGDDWQNLLHRLENTPIPNFQLKGRDIVAAGIPPGDAVGVILAAAEARWITAGFPRGKAAALEILAEITAS